MINNLYISNIFCTFVAYKEIYDRGRVNQRNRAEKAAVGTGWEFGSGI